MRCDEIMIKLSHILIVLAEVYCCSVHFMDKVKGITMLKTNIHKSHVAHVLDAVANC